MEAVAAIVLTNEHLNNIITLALINKKACKLLCYVFDKLFKTAGGTNRAHWEDVTENTPLTFVNDCVSFTTTVSARYWLIDCRHIEDATKMATELYR